MTGPDDRPVPSHADVVRDAQIAEWRQELVRLRILLPEEPSRLHELHQIAAQSLESFAAAEEPTRRAAWRRAAGAFDALAEAVTACRNPGHPPASRTTPHD